MKNEDDIQIEVMDNGYVVYVNRWDVDDSKRKGVVFFDVEDVLAYVAEVLKGK